MGRFVSAAACLYSSYWKTQPVAALSISTLTDEVDDDDFDAMIAENENDEWSEAGNAEAERDASNASEDLEEPLLE